MSCIYTIHTAALHLSAAGDRIAANPPQRQCEFNRRCGGSSKILSGSGETLSDERHVAAGDIDFGFESRIPSRSRRIAILKRLYRRARCRFKRSINRRLR